MFSPFALPRVILLQHNHHNRARYSSAEHLCSWSFQLVRFDGVAGGDEVQQRLAKQFPEGITGLGVHFRHSQPRGDVKGGFEDLCSTEFIEPPTVHDLGGANLWTAIFGIEKDNLNNRQSQDDQVSAIAPRRI